MLVTRVLGDCPQCGAKNRFGNVSVRDDQLLRGCKSCNYSSTVWLPRIRKKIVYLDQFFFSGAFRAGESRFVEVAHRIRQLSDLQLLVVPFSSIHEDETHQWRGYGGKNKEDLMEFIKATSRGHKFKPAYDVEQTQIIRAFQAFLAGHSPEFALEEQHIATYAPYCDAFIMDQPMAALVASPHVDLEKRYGVKAYSLNTWDELLAWLDTVEIEMTDDHKAGLSAAYP